MSKIIKIGIPVVVILGVGYGIGTYYAHKIANQEADKAITAIKKKSPEVQTIHYGSVNAGFFSLFTKAVSIEDVNITLKSLPNNPLHIDQIDIHNITLDANKAPSTFAIDYQGLSITDAKTLVNQLLPAQEPLIPQQTYHHLSQNNVHLQAEEQQAVHRYIKSIADQYAQASLSGDIEYNSQDQSLVTQLSITVEGDTAYTFNSKLTDYTIENTNNGFMKAFNNAKIASLDYKLDLNHFGDLKILGQGIPQYQSIADELKPDIQTELHYSSKTNDLTFNFDIKNPDDQNADKHSFELHHQFLLHDVQLSQYSLSELNQNGIMPAFKQAYFGSSDSTVDLNSTLTHQNISNLPAPYNQYLESVFGKKDINLFLHMEEQANYDDHGKGSDTLQFGIKDMGNINMDVKYNYTDKLYLKAVLDYLNTSYDELQQAQNQQQSLDDEIKLMKHIKIKQVDVELNNQSLVQNLIELYSKMANQKPDAIKSVIMQQFGKASKQAESPFTKALFGATAEFINKPEQLAVKFTPKQPLSWADVLQTYQQTEQKIRKLEAEQENQNEQTPPSRLEEQRAKQREAQLMHQAYQDILALFHYQFTVNGKAVNHSLNTQ